MFVQELCFGTYNNKNAISYIYPNFQEGILTAKYIPMILAICGDKSDEILGVSGVGASKAVKLIEKNNIPWNIDILKRDIKDMPKVIQDNINIIIRNYKLISFEEQIKRLPKDFLSLWIKNVSLGLEMSAGDMLLCMSTP